MRGGEETNQLSLDQLLKELALAPIIGFVLALLYESSFFFFLDVPLNLVLRIEDIVWGSAIIVLPVIPLLLFGFAAAAPPEDLNGKPPLEKVVTVLKDGPYYFLMSSVVIGSFAFLLLGIGHQFGVYFSLLVLLMLAGRLFLFNLLFQLKKEGFLIVWLLLITSIMFIGKGANDAFAIRSDRFVSKPIISFQNAPLPDGEYHLLRRLSSGSLIATPTPNSVFFVTSEGSSATKFEIDTEPFRGILCYSFEFCDYSGW